MNRLKALSLLEKARDGVWRASGFIKPNKLQRRCETIESKIIDLIEDIKELADY